MVFILSVLQVYLAMEMLSWKCSVIRFIVNPIYDDKTEGQKNYTQAGRI